MVTHGSFLSSISTIFSLKASKFILLTHGHLRGDSIFLDIYTHIFLNICLHIQNNVFNNVYLNYLILLFLDSG